MATPERVIRDGSQDIVGEKRRARGEKEGRKGVNTKKTGKEERKGRGKGGGRKCQMWTHSEV